jgi:3-oxoacyl-[acyl-carrier protein] reductase
LKLQNRVAVVTGSSRGIGKSIALALAGEGADVAVNFIAKDVEAVDYYADDNRLAAEETVREIKALGREAIAVEADVTRADRVEALITATVERFGRVDILVNNAGYSERGFLTDLSEAQWDSMIDVVMKGAFLCARAVAPHMIEHGGGKIISISSDTGKAGAQLNGVHYAAAKAGTIGLTRALARQLAPYHINCNDVCPAEIKTDMTSRRTPEQQARDAKAIPLGRFGTPEEVAAAVVFLASSDADYITGASLDLNGGMYMGQ